MKDTIRLSLLAALLPVYLFTNAQVETNDTLFIQRNEKGTIVFARFKANESSDRKMKNDTIFLKSVLKAKEGDGFRLKSEETDELGITHRKYQQYFRGVKVDNREYVLHGKDGEIEVINGDFQVINIESVKPVLTERQALAKALEYVGAKRYKWEDEGMELFVKQHRNDPTATYYPKGELVVAEESMKGSNSFQLSWQFTISSLEPENEQMIFVDATNGAIIRDIPLILDANTNGTAQTMYSSTQTISCDSYSGGFRLYESRATTSGKTVIIRTLNCLNGTNYSNAVEFSNTTTNWTSAGWPAFAQNQAALDVHWAVERVLSYWASVHSRNSLNGSGLDVKSYVHYKSAWSNAQWDDTYNVMRFGDGDGSLFGPLTALDVVAHEFGHGINKFTVALTGGNSESGALSEGFSDIWAACVKAWAAPYKPRWRSGSEIMLMPLIFNHTRDMQNPGAPLSMEGLHPSRYQGTNWDFANDPHTNSTVLGHWFYLLCEGGSGNNDGITFDVAGIGISKAERIAYKALSNSYLTSSSNYAAARNATVSAATILYNANSMEVVSVTNAWHAVGVGDRHPPVISGPTLICYGSPQPFSFSDWESGYYWDKSSNLSLSGTTSSSITVSATNNNGSAGWISVKDSNGTEVLRQDVWVGPPVITIEGPDYVCSAFSPGYNTYHYVATPTNILSAVSPAAYAPWTVIPGGQVVDIYRINNNHEVMISFLPWGAYYEIQYQVSNACGCSPMAVQYVWAEPCYSPSPPAYPNPASDILYVEIEQVQRSGQNTPGAQNATPDPTFDIRLYNGQGNLVRQTASKAGTIQLNVANLPNGLYYLQIYGEKSRRPPQIQQIIVEH